MSRLVAAFILLAGLGAEATLAQTIDVTSLAFSTPSTVAELESRRIKGDPVRLAWSPDMKQIYVQFAERDRRGAISKLTHVTVAVGEGKIDTAGREPDWAATYWAWKSAQASPVAPGFKIVADSKEETVRATGAAMGGDLARGGGAGGAAGGAGAGAGVSVDEVTAATNQTQKIVRWTLRLKNEVIGEWVNQAVVPGLTFGWHAKRPVIAFGARDGDLVIMDESGRKKTVDGVDDTSLPAWSDDGSKIATLVKDGRRGWKLSVIDVRWP